MEPFPRFALYTAIKRLGEGSNSVVFLAKGCFDGRLRALKVFNLAGNSSAEFLRELELTSQADHPNVIRLIDFGRTLNTAQDYLAFEYLEGQDFVTAFKKASQHQFYSMLAQVCRSLDFIHRRGLSHGDLKPQNIIVADSKSQLNPPLLKLIDLGYCQGSDLPDSWRARGSPHYLAPEIIRGRSSTPASDLYAFGAIIYECLTGFPPFRGGDVGDVLQRHLHSDPSPIESGALHELHSLVYHLLSKDPIRRPTSAADALRLINVASPVGNFRLDTAETWKAKARSCPLVGRDHLLSEAARVFREAANTTDSAKPTMILLRGERGAGKTRLIRALSLLARTAGFNVLMLQSSSEGLALETVTTAVALMSRSSLRSPVLVAFDDLISTDLDPSRFIRHILLEAVPPEVLLLTINTSNIPVQEMNSIQESLEEQVQLVDWTLPPLNERETEDAVRRMVNFSHVDPKAISVLGAQSGGNPLLLVSLIASYLDQEAFACQHSSLNVRPGVASLSTPPLINDLAAQIVGQVAPKENDVVAVLAVANDTWPTSNIASFLGMEQDVIWRICSQLADRGILRCRVRDGVLGYSVASESVRAVLLRRLSPGKRLSVHEKVARFYLNQSQGTASIEKASVHFAEAGMRDEVILWSSTAANRAKEELQYVAAVNSFRLALSQEVNDSLAKVELRLGLAHCLLKLSQVSESSDLLDALDGDPDLPAGLRAKVRILRSRCARYIGDSPNHYKFASSALELAPSNGMRREVMQAMWLVGSAMCSLGRPREGLRVLYKTGRMARRDGHRVIASYAMMDASAALWKAGMYKRALSYARRQYGLLRDADRPVQVAHALQNLGILQSELGMYAQARRNQTRGLESHQPSSAEGEATRFLGNIGETYRAQGRWRKALGYYRGALKGARAGGDSRAILVTGANVGQVLSTIGHSREALISLRHSMITARTLGSTDATIALLTSWATLLLAMGRHSAAYRLTSHACQLVESAQLWQWMLELKRCRAMALWNQGKVDEAHGVIVEAIARYGERSPFDVRLSANLTQAQFEQGRGAGLEAMEEMLRPLLETARRKRMRWHLATGLLVRAEALLGANLAEQAESGLQEALGIAYKTADRTLSWQAGYLLGRVYEQMLRYERALGYYRMAALTIHELSMNIEEERYRESYLSQPRVREARERYDRLLTEVETYSRSVIQQVARGQTLLTVDVGKDPTLSAYKSVVLHEIKSILCVPMRARGKVAGVIYLDTRRGPQLFTDKERAFVESFASQAAIAIENARVFGLMKAENARLQLEAQNRGRFENLIGTSPAMTRLREVISGVLESDCS